MHGEVCEFEKVTKQQTRDLLNRAKVPETPAGRTGDPTAAVAAPLSVPWGNACDAIAARAALTDATKALR